MSDPIEYAVVRNLQAALQAIAVSAGFHYNVADIAVKLDPNHKVEDFITPDGPRPFIILELKPEDWSYQPAGRVVLVVPVTIHWVCESTPEEDESRLRTYLCGCADVERAIAKDISRGGLVVDTRIVKRTCDESTEGTQVWAMIDVEIRLHRIYGAPDAG
jgi:hypothetical protein